MRRVVQTYVAGNNDQENSLQEWLYNTIRDMHTYDPQEAISTHSDPGHWEKKSWITIDTKRFLLLTDYGANDENTLKMGVRQPSPNIEIKMTKRIASFNCCGRGSSREYVAKLVK